MSIIVQLVLCACACACWVLTSWWGRPCRGVQCRFRGWRFHGRCSAGWISATYRNCLKTSPHGGWSPASAEDERIRTQTIDKAQDVITDLEVGSEFLKILYYLVSCQWWKHAHWRFIAESMILMRECDCCCNTHHFQYNCATITCHLVWKATSIHNANLIKFHLTEVIF